MHDVLHEMEMRGGRKKVKGEMMNGENVWKDGGI